MDCRFRDAQPSGGWLIGHRPERALTSVHATEPAPMASQAYTAPAPTNRINTKATADPTTIQKALRRYVGRRRSCRRASSAVAVDRLRTTCSPPTPVIISDSRVRTPNGLAYRTSDLRSAGRSSLTGYLANHVQRQGNGSEHAPQPAAVRHYPGDPHNAQNQAGLPVPGSVTQKLPHFHHPQSRTPEQ